jgi:hypothetical protein
VILIAFHSFVDYPLRTAAIMAVVAFACGLLVAPSTQADKETSLQKECSGRHSVKKQRRHAPARVGTAPLAGSVRTSSTPSRESGWKP